MHAEVKGARQVGAAVAGVALVAFLVLAVGNRGSPGVVNVLVGSTDILARAESLEHSTRALAEGKTIVQALLKQHGDVSLKQQGHAHVTQSALEDANAVAKPKESAEQELRHEISDMQQMKNIRTYIGGGGKIIAEAKHMEMQLKKMMKDTSQAHSEKLKSSSAPSALKEGGGGGHKAALGTEHALARQEELVDCEPFCDTKALEKNRRKQHEQLLKKEARERMNQREKMRRSQEEAQSELQAHCLFCKHTVVKRDRAQDGIKAIHLLDTSNLLKASGLKDSDMNTKTNQLQLPSLHAAQDAGRRSELTEAPRKLSKLTRSEEEKVEKAADQIATLMGSGSHDSSDVDKEMAKMQSRGMQPFTILYIICIYIRERERKSVETVKLNGKKRHEREIIFRPLYFVCEDIVCQDIVYLDIVCAWVPQS